MLNQKIGVFDNFSKIRISLLCIAVFGVISGAGCSRTPNLYLRPGMVLAKGIVTLDGSPMDTGQIALISEGATNPGDDDQQHLASITNGHFEMEIAPGRYQVRIQKYEYEKRGIAKPLLPEKYNIKSELSTEISEKGPHQLSFSLQSK